MLIVNIELTTEIKVLLKILKGHFSKDEIFNDFYPFKPRSHLVQTVNYVCNFTELA